MVASCAAFSSLASSSARLLQGGFCGGAGHPGLSARGRRLVAGGSAVAAGAVARAGDAGAGEESDADDGAASNESGETGAAAPDAGEDAAELRGEQPPGVG